MHNLVFTGQILDGFPAEQVREQLLGMLKLPAEQSHRVFSGQPVTLKRNLTPTDAERYVKHLKTLGIGIEVHPPLGGGLSFPKLILEDEATPAPPPAAVAVAPAAPPPPEAPPVVEAAPTPMPLIEDVTCPKCGERQPKRTLCRACSTDMPRFAAAQQAAEAEARAARMQASASGAGKVGSLATAPRDAAAGTVEFTDAPAWFGFDFDGRFGRLTYLWAGCAALLIMVLGIALELKTMKGAAMLLSMLFALFVTLRITALRCHDLGWSGWAALFALIPYVGSLFSLLLLFLPGEKRDNAYGSPPHQAGKPAAIIGVASLLLSVALSVSIMNQTMLLAAQYMGGVSAEDSMYEQEDDVGVPTPPPGGYSPNNQVVIYHVDINHPSSQELNEGLKAMGLYPRLVQLPPRGDDLDTFITRLMAEGHDISNIQLPVVEVNRKMIPNNPSLQTIARHLEKN